MRLLLALASHSPDYGNTLIQHMLGLSHSSPPLPDTSVPPIAVGLFYSLCVPSSDHSAQRSGVKTSLLSESVCNSIILHAHAGCPSVCACCPHCHTPTHPPSPLWYGP